MGYKDEKVLDPLRSKLEEGEEIEHFAFGVRPPALWLIILLIACAILPGVIAVFLLTKNYYVGLTNRRLLILEVGRDRVKSVIAFPRDDIPQGETSTGGIFTHIKINSEPKPWKAKFHRMGMRENREHAMAIGAVVARG
jgi:hypothetical protein